MIYEKESYEKFCTNIMQLLLLRRLLYSYNVSSKINDIYGDFLMDIAIKFKDTTPENLHKSVHDYITIIHFNDFSKKYIDVLGLSRLTFTEYDSKYSYSLTFDFGHAVLIIYKPLNNKIRSNFNLSINEHQLHKASIVRADNKELNMLYDDFVKRTHNLIEYTLDMLEMNGYFKNTYDMWNDFLNVLVRISNYNLDIYYNKADG